MGDTIGMNGLGWGLEIEGKFLPDFVEDFNTGEVESDGYGVAAGGEVVGWEAPAVFVCSGGKLDRVDRAKEPESNAIAGGIEKVDFEGEFLDFFVGDLGENFDDGRLALFAFYGDAGLFKVAVGLGSGFAFPKGIAWGFEILGDRFLGRPDGVDLTAF